MFEKRVLSSELKDYIDKEVVVSGWLYKKREMGNMIFIVLRDRHGLMQIVGSAKDSAKLQNLYNGTILKIFGKVIEEKRAIGGIEIHDPKIEVLIPVTEIAPIEIDKPINHKSENLDTLFDNRIANMRNVVEQGIFKIQAAVSQSAAEYLRNQDFTEFHSPKLLAEATEGGAEVFKLDYFGKLASLAQSAQFYKQIMVGAFERVYEIGPTYRAELSMTTRHMSEFITIDAEMGFVNGLEDILNILSGLVNFVSEKVWKNQEKELLALKATKPILTKNFPKITLKKLHELYLKEKGEDLRAEKDPTPAEERFISEYSAKNWNSEAVFITEFPASAMKFYHRKSEANKEVAERADLIFRGVEIVTTSLREHRYPILLTQLKEMGGDPNNPGFKYFLQAFKYGMPPHGGFGLGLERLTQKIIGLNSIKEATIFPRDVNRLSP